VLPKGLRFVGNLEREEGSTEIHEVDHRDELHTIDKKGQEIACVARFSRGQVTSFSVFDQEHSHPYYTKRRHQQQPPQGVGKSWNLAPLEDEDDSNKHWVIVRYMPGAKFTEQDGTGQAEPNTFRLTGGETLKIGRVKFRVREIALQAPPPSKLQNKGDTGSDENKTDFNSFLDGGNAPRQTLSQMVVRLPNLQQNIEDLIPE